MQGHRPVPSMAAQLSIIAANRPNATKVAASWMRVLTILVSLRFGAGDVEVNAVRAFLLPIFVPFVRRYALA